ncbi:hypothetical protein [Paenibacillus sp. SI8]|uniref:hypothetical protein n=1 Tax=unclassified Paenibacillus TaxID=185978 RepID=UPI003464EC69
MNDDIMRETLMKILDRLGRIEDKIDSLKASVDSQHTENIEADEKLLEAIRTTNDRLDYQRNKLSKTEEELYLLKQKH